MSVWFIQKLLASGYRRIDSLETYRSILDSMIREYYRTHIASLSKTEVETLQKLWSIIEDKGYIRVFDALELVNNEWSLLDSLFHRNILLIRDDQIVPQNKLVDKTIRKYILGKKQL